MFAAVMAGALAILTMWWLDTPASSLADLGSKITAAGRITGLLGTYLVLVEVLLMGRIAWLDRLIGMDRLAVWHRRNGQYAIWLLVAHTVLTVWGYAVSDHTGVVHETGTVVLSYPDVLAATFALGLLILIGVVSARAARRRLRFETWYFIHLYTYLAIALSFAHQLATGNDFIAHPANRVLWVGFYVISLGLLVAYRAVIPVRNAVRQQLRVASVVAEAPGVVSIYVTGRHLEELRADAGQFFLWRFLTRAGWWQAHPFSLSAAPNPEWLRVMVKAAGDYTAKLQTLQPGTRVIAEGPYGAFTEARRTRRKVLLVGGGVGIAPLRSLMETLRARPGDITLLYRARRQEDLAFREEIDALAQNRGAKVHYLVGSRRKAANSFDPAALRTLVPKIASHDVYLCGPPAMKEQAIVGLLAAGVPRRHIHVEDFEL
ncbi:MAG: hypothetical protein QOH66_3017 [Actinomycetota bacterium]|nr:hypothetical protein [Actinomycetota bacterium]